jgi:DNA replicative helicase MCM subunit Mcm2 (Cdc46/Mcm family)
MHLREEATVEDAYKTIEIMKESLESSGRDPISGKIDVRLAEGRTPARKKKIDKIVEKVIVEFNEEYYNPAKPYEWFNKDYSKGEATIKVLELGRKEGLTGLTLANAEEELKKGITLRLTNGIP